MVYLVIWRNHHRWENQVTWRSVGWPKILLSPFYTFSEQQPKAIQDKAFLHQSWSLCTEQWKVQKYVLLLEYLKLVVNCSCVQNENKKQKEIIHLVDPRTLQNKAAKKIFWIIESKNMSIASIGNSIFDEIDNVKWYILHFIQILSFIPNHFNTQVLVLGLIVRKYTFLRQDNYRNIYKEWLKFCQ